MTDAEPPHAMMTAVAEESASSAGPKASHFEFSTRQVQAENP